MVVRNGQQSVDEYKHQHPVIWMMTSGKHNNSSSHIGHRRKCTSKMIPTRGLSLFALGMMSMLMIISYIPIPASALPQKKNRPLFSQQQQEELKQKQYEKRHQRQPLNDEDDEEEEGLDQEEDVGEGEGGEDDYEEFVIMEEEEFNVEHSTSNKNGNDHSSSNKNKNVIRDSNYHKHRVVPSPFQQCEDVRDQCTQWSQQGLCNPDQHQHQNPTSSIMSQDDKNNHHPTLLYIQAHCPRSCQLCHQQTRSVPIQESFGLAPPRSLDDSLYDVVDAIGSDIGIAQVMVPNNRSAIFRSVQRARKYIYDEVMTDPKYTSVRTTCRNMDPFCAHRAAILGHCNSDDNEIDQYMTYNCAPICLCCEYLSAKSLCPIDPAIKNVWYRNDLNTMFENIVTNPMYQSYNITVLSRPTFAQYDTKQNATYHIGGPWLILLNNLFDDKVANRLIELGTKSGYERSIGGVSNPDGTLSQIVGIQRTSSNTWCDSIECRKDPLIQDLLYRMEQLTNIPTTNGEFLQLLKYEPGEYYTQHNDMIPHEIEFVQGVRILTIFLYLNNVEEGGGTHFPYLNVTIQPKRGRAVIWPSVLNEHPHNVDSRTDHVALPVKKGLKYGANTWFHQRDFKGPESEGCLMDHPIQEKINMYTINSSSSKNKA